MRGRSMPFRPLARLVVAMLCTLGIALAASAQSQEPKPTFPATPISGDETVAIGTPSSGVSGSTWQGANWGISVAWDPVVWMVEGELIESGYEGLQIGTSVSTVFIEAYDGFGGDAEACLDDAERELRDRESVTEAAVLEGRQLPELGDATGSARLFGLLIQLSDGAVVRGVEYIECRTLVPGTAVLELTWQTPASDYNAEMPLVETLLGSISLPGMATPIPSAPIPAPPAVAKPTISPSPERASAK